ncbi:MAG: ribonuclease P protein component [Deltaproteobacteria bacterium]|nr:ribonuclease P protein component [Deltaproteobacteria bacterium]
MSYVGEGGKVERELVLQVIKSEIELREDFPPCYRITTKRDIEELKSSNNKLKGKYVILVYKKNNLPFCRLLVVVSSKFGNAVKRNRMKRIIREIFRKKIKNRGGYDIMIIPKGNAMGQQYAVIEEDVLGLVNFIPTGHKDE